MHTPEQNFSPEPRIADDTLIGELTSLIDAFPNFYKGEDAVQNGRNQGIAVLKGEDIAFELWVGPRYGYIEYSRPQPYAENLGESAQEPELTTLMYIDGFLGDVTNLRVPNGGIWIDQETLDTVLQQGQEDSTGDVIEDYEREFAREKATEQLTGDLLASASLKPNDYLTLEQVDAFNSRNPMFSFMRGMAETDVILAEHARGFPVFYGLAPRPTEQLVRDLIECFKSGELLYGKGKSSDSDYDDAVKAYDPTAKTYTLANLPASLIKLITNPDSEEFTLPPDTE